MLTILIIIIGLLLGYVVGLAFVIGSVGVATGDYADGVDRGIAAIMFLIGAAVVVFTFMLTTDALGKTHYFDTPDPCVEVHSTGKTSWTEHHKGWFSYGGRYVWCGPGEIPAGVNR